MKTCYKLIVNSPLGELTILGNEEAVCGLYMQDQKYIPTHQIANSPFAKLDTLSMAAQWLIDYFAGKTPTLEHIPLCLRGTAFQLDVWKQLAKIPYGSTITYGQIAKTLAKAYAIPAMSAQAVGSAVSRNPLSIIIPCHRVLAANGAITGYAGGIPRKIWLLEHEKRVMTSGLAGDLIKP